jgi:hypothetical protein
VLGEAPPPPARRRLQVFASIYAVLGGLVAGGLLLADLTLGAVASGIAVTLALVGVTARRSQIPGAFGILLAYAFAWGLLMWAALFVAWLALWDGWQ